MTGRTLKIMSFALAAVGLAHVWAKPAIIIIGS